MRIGALGQARKESPKGSVKPGIKSIYFLIPHRASAAAARNGNFTCTALTSFPNIILKASSVWAKR